jgi:hypothetical protein
MTHPSAPIHTTAKMRVMKKNKIGTPMSLFVSHKKSAEASMTSIANFNDLNPRQTQHKKPKARIDKTTSPIIKYIY